MMRLRTIFPAPTTALVKVHVLFMLTIIFGLFNISEDLPAVTPCMFIYLGAVLQGKQHKIISN